MDYINQKSLSLLFPSTLSTHSNHDGQVGIHKEPAQKREEPGENIFRRDAHRLEEMLQTEREERRRLELEKEKLRQEKRILEEQRGRETGRSHNMLVVCFSQKNKWIWG